MWTSEYISVLGCFFFCLSSTSIFHVLPCAGGNQGQSCPIPPLERPLLRLSVTQGTPTGPRRVQLALPGTLSFRIRAECSVASRVLWKQVRASASASLIPWAYGVLPVLTWSKDTSRSALLGTRSSEFSCLSPLVQSARTSGLQQGRMRASSFCPHPGLLAHGRSLCG